MQMVFLEKLLGETCDMDFIIVFVSVEYFRCNSVEENTSLDICVQFMKTLPSSCAFLFADMQANTKSTEIPSESFWLKD